MRASTRVASASNAQVQHGVGILVVRTGEAQDGVREQARRAELGDQVGERPRDQSRRHAKARSGDDRLALLDRADPGAQPRRKVGDRQELRVRRQREQRRRQVGMRIDHGGLSSRKASAFGSQRSGSTPARRISASTAATGSSRGVARRAIRLAASRFVTHALQLVAVLPGGGSTPEDSRPLPPASPVKGTPCARASPKRPVERACHCFHVGALVEVGDDLVGPQQPLDATSDLERSHIGSHELIDDAWKGVRQRFRPRAHVELADRGELRPGRWCGRRSTNPKGRSPRRPFPARRRAPPPTVMPSTAIGSSSGPKSRSMAGPRGTVPKRYSHCATTPGSSDKPLAAMRRAASDRCSMRPFTRA